MSSLPSSATKTHLDQSSDDPKQGRSEIAALIDKFNNVLQYLTELLGADGEKETARATLQYGGTAADDLNLDGNVIHSAAIKRAPSVSVATGTHTINYNAGNWHRITASGDFTLALSNFPAQGAALYIEASNWGNYDITLPTGLKTPEQEALSFSTGIDIYAIYKLFDDSYVMKPIDENIGVPS